MRRRKAAEKVRSTVLRQLEVVDGHYRRDQATTDQLRQYRDRLICVAVDCGISMTEIADTLGYSQPLISQIVARSREEQSH